MIAALSVRNDVQPRRLDPVSVQSELLDAGATLFLTPVIDVRKNSPDWKTVQLVLTHNLLLLDGGLFKPQVNVTAEELSAALQRLASDPAKRPVLTLPLTRIEAARAFRRCLETPVTRP